MAPSFKRKVKRLPLADITNLFNNSAQGQNGVSYLPSVPLSLHSASRNRTPVLLRGSKNFRMGFR
uniref:Uncharacterized protein n=1 Tax=Cajanus cajan TaxID=3821 RepID=A0A151SEP7_CAJCA|nr:hypothetical protein KK1_024687 [Cajanus cajan]